MQAISVKIFNDIQFGNIFTKVLPPVISVVLTIVLANNLASLTWLSLPSPPAVPAPADLSAINLNAPQAVSSSSNTVALQVSSWHLFGEVQKDLPKPVEVIPEVVEEAPDTTLHLTLRGVIASRDMLSAWAIIADRMGNEDSYGIDAQVPDGAVLKEIFVDRVILLHNGRLETLRLPLEDTSGFSTESPVRPNVPQTVSRSSSAPSRTVVPSGTVTQLDFGAAQVVKSYKEKLLSDPQSVMNTLRAEPYRQGGELKGYRIFPGRDKDLFGQVGLEPGDVVTAVNGIELDSPLKGLEVMQNITDASEVSVNVLRNGVNQTFVVPLN